MKRQASWQKCNMAYGHLVPVALFLISVQKSNKKNIRERRKYQGAEMPSSLDQVSETWTSLHLLLFQAAWNLQLDWGLSRLFLVPFQLCPSFFVPVHKWNVIRSIHIAYHASSSTFYMKHASILTHKLSWNVSALNYLQFKLCTRFLQKQLCISTVMKKNELGQLPY